MEITYEKVGDYRLPRLEPGEAAAPSLGMWAQMRLSYLESHRRALYTNLLTTGRLNAHLAEVESQATEMMERLASQMAKREGADETMKLTDRMGWVGIMNGIQASARETVIRDLIHS